MQTASTLTAALNLPRFLGLVTYCQSLACLHADEASKLLIVLLGEKKSPAFLVLPENIRLSLKIERRGFLHQTNTHQ